MTATKTIGVPFEDYVADEAVHATVLKAMLKSPLAYRHVELNGRPDKDVLRVGRAVHTAVLEPDLFRADFAVWLETTDAGASSPRRGAKWEAFRAAHAGKTILTRAQYESSCAIADAVRAYPLARQLLDDPEGEAEVSIRWVHQATGLACKSRIDFLSPRAIVELKSAADVEPRAFASSSARFLYHLQLGFYAMAVESLGIAAPPSKVIAVSKEAPYDVVVYGVDEEMLAVGRNEAEKAMRLLAECRASDSWPGLARGQELTLELPEWALDDDEAGWQVGVKASEHALFGEV